MKKSCFLTVSALALGFLAGSFLSGCLRAAQVSGKSVIVLCSSCSLSGLPERGHLFLMDSETGEIWVYSDEALEGKAKPVHWGRLVLGQSVVRTNQ